MIAGGMRRNPALPIAVGGLAGVGALAAAVAARGADPLVGVAIVAGGLVALLLLANARAAVLVALLAVVLAEGHPEWGVPFTAKLYEPIMGLEPGQALMALAAAAVLIDVVRHGERLRWPTVFAGPLLLAAAAMLFGLLDGALGGAAESFRLRGFVESLLPLFVFPVLIVNVVRTREDLRRALGLAGALAAAKAVIGLAVVGLGRAERTSLTGPRLTYYESAPNWILMTTLLAVAGARLARVRLPRWMVWSTPLILLALVLSYRRTYWIATVACLVLVALAAGGRVRRRLAVPAVVLVLGAGWLLWQAGAVGGLQGPVVERAQTLTPSKVSRNQEDRYRLDERRNVLAELGHRPLTGLGAGVPWRARYPLGFEYESGRQYVHMAVLWWWLKMGILGAISYVWLMVSAMLAGVEVWRRHPDGMVRVCGLAAGTAILGLAIVELASTVLGADFRSGAVIGAVLGLLAVAVAQARAEGPAAHAASIRP